MRTGGREADDVAIGADPARHLLAELEQHARRVGIGISDVHRLIELQVADIAEPIGRIIDASAGRSGFRLVWE